MRLSHGNICRLVEFLSGLRQGRICSLGDFVLISHCTHDERLWLERFCELCRLTRLSNGISDELTELGETLATECLSSRNNIIVFRNVLKTYIENVRPCWANRMPAGRSETYVSLNDDEYYCFRQAGLASDTIDDAGVEWWDSVANLFRSETEARALATGRAGERLTIKYEQTRTGYKPKWESVESNFSGYDILSRESSLDGTPRLIEVKSSTMSQDEASFFVSRNEWDTAVNSAGHYFFYLWLLSPIPSLAIVPSQDVGRHMSLDRGNGNWRSVEVPFSEFSKLFANQ